MSHEEATVREDPRWAAVLARDTTADGMFFYSVRTTGVYCRPSCGARRPKQENVAFHATAAEAEAKGFRACRRCRPDRPRRGDPRVALVTGLCRFIEESAEIPTLAVLARRAGLGPDRTHRLFKAVTGVTPRAYAAAHRGRRMRAALRSSPDVTSAMLEAGYASSGRFYEDAAGELGMTPTRFRKGGAGVTIRHATAPCSLGRVLVAATGRGVCAILLGDDERGLADDLGVRFPAAERVPADDTFCRTVAAVVALVEDPAAGIALPLDIRGTAFQRRVWEALSRIPPGRVTTYAELAVALGIPRGGRAVARACADNPLAVAVPCHRVVRADGGLAGYRWGIERKRTLLEREGRSG